jgi:hypothetical protein
MLATLVIIAVLLLLSLLSLQRFMRDMAVVEKELLKEIKEMKNYLMKLNEKQL